MRNREPKQRAHLPLPVADQTRGRDDEHAADESPGQHLADVEPRHDGLAGPGVVGPSRKRRGACRSMCSYTAMR